MAWLDHGAVQSVGAATDTISAYLTQVNAEETMAGAAVAAERGDDSARHAATSSGSEERRACAVNCRIGQRTQHRRSERR